MDLRGKMIVLEGVDGVGKSTAAALVAERLTQRGCDVAFHDFPEYDDPAFGALTHAVLDGSLRIEGPLKGRAIATLFAGNRAATAGRLRSEQEAGRTLLCDRYHLANAAYQGAQATDPDERDAIMRWVLEVELEVLGVLRPDVSVWLRLPLDLRPPRGRDHDVFERDYAFQQRVHDAYARLAELGEITAVDLAPGGALLPPDDVADAVLAAVDAALGDRG